MSGAATVHPDFKEVIPLMPEPIVKQDLHYILGVKPGDHAFLSGQVESAEDAGLVTAIEFTADNVIHRFRFVNLMPLNKSGVISKFC